MNLVNSIGVIIPAAGMGRRMKSYGPKSLIKIGNSTIIKNQINLLQTYFSPTTIVLVCGFKATVLMNETPDHILKVENERYEYTNVVRSIGIGLRVMGTCPKIIIVYGDLVFNSATLKDIKLTESSIIVTNQEMGEVSNNGLYTVISVTIFLNRIIAFSSVRPLL